MDVFFSENNIVNKEYYEGIKSMINCIICCNIIENPVQCTKCQHFYCKECIKIASNKCPLRCENCQFIKAITCNNLLSNLKFKCNCNEIVNYDEREKHLDACKNKDFEKYYLFYKEKYENLKKEKNINDEIKSPHYIKVSNHKHPMEILRRYENCWFCNNCDKTFSEDTPSYYCSLCDFDLCVDCSKLFLVQGKVYEIKK